MNATTGSGTPVREHDELSPEADRKQRNQGRQAVFSAVPPGWPRGLSEGAMSTSTERVPISKKTRFDIFRRDSFTCRYCGRCPPSVMLVIDHIIPVSRGGTNDSANFATSCNECNQGKGARPMANADRSHEDQMTSLQERMEEYCAAETAIKTIRKLKLLRAEVASVFKEITGLEVREKANLSGLCRIAQEEGIDTLLEFLDLATRTIRVLREREVMMYVYGCARRAREMAQDQK